MNTNERIMRICTCLETFGIVALGVAVANGQTLSDPQQRQARNVVIPQESPARQARTSAGLGAATASMATQLGDFRVDRISKVQLRVGAGCTNATPCNFRIGGTVTAITAAMDVNITTATGAGKVLLYVSNAGTVMAATSTGLNVNCTGGCGAIANVSYFPPDSIPLYEWSATTTVGQWNTRGTDRRATYVSKVLTVGTGLTRVDNTSTGVTDLSVDPAVVGIRVGLPVSASSASSACR